MEQKDYRLAAIMFTDIHSFSRMMEKNEAGTLELLKLHNEMIIEIVKRHNGSVIKTIGDAFLVDFKSTVDALQSALEIQDKLYVYNKAHTSLPLLLRIGLHLGDIYFFENDALGEGINIASRLQSVAHPGCICMSQDVYNHVLNKIDFQAEKLGRVSLKNISKEIHAYEIKTPNIEFDPNHDKPRSGYKPGAFAQDSDIGSIKKSTIGSWDEEIKVDAESKGTRETEHEQSTSTKAQNSSVSPDFIKKRILDDIKLAGRRLTVDEVRARYAEYGQVTEDVIENLAQKGIISRYAEQNQSRANYDEGRTSYEERQPRSDDFIRPAMGTVNNILSMVEKGIEQAMQEETNNRSNRGERGRGQGPHYESRSLRREIKSQIKESLRSEFENQDKSDDKESKKISEWDKKLKGSHFKGGDEDKLSDWSLYKEEAAISAHKVGGSFIANVFTFLSISAFLIFLNIFTSPGFPWAFFPVAAWGMGIAEHFFASRRKNQKNHEIQKMPNLNADQLLLYKRLNRIKDSYLLHKVSAFTLSAFLIGVNLITSASFMWAFIPAFFLFASLFSHKAIQASKKIETENRLLRSLGVEGPWKRLFEKTRPSKLENKKSAQTENTTPVNSKYLDQYNQALSIKNSIIESLKGAKNKRGVPLTRDIVPELDHFIELVKVLSDRASETDAIIQSVPLENLQFEITDLQQKVGASDNPRMKKEYERSLFELTEQEKSFKELQNQHEMLNLRLKSSVNSLKQMQIDLGKLKSMPDADSDQTVAMVKQRTYELYQYLEDMKTGFYELGANDPYKELADIEVMEKELKLRMSADGYAERDFSAPKETQAPEESKEASQDKPLEVSKDTDTSVPKASGEADAPKSETETTEEKKPEDNA